MKPLKVLVTPDYRELAPYQALLAEALEEHGVHSEYLTGTRRGLPLTRGVPGYAADLLHLHWFEHLVRGQGDVLRRLRLVTDLRLATRRTPLIYTVHDLFPTGWPETPLNRWVVRGVLRSASALIVHSSGARDVVCRTFSVAPERCAVIPHGDQTPTYGAPMSRREARARLGLGDEKLCLAFGAVLPNKGMVELVEWWARERPGITLAVVGHAYDASLARRMNKIAADAPQIDLRFGFQSDRQVNAWFSAADCAVTNYSTIFTSGVACLARSWGVPILLPRRLTTIDLMEPDEAVLRYDELAGDFAERLTQAAALGADYSRAAVWREATSWRTVAARTAGVYRETLGAPATARVSASAGV